MSHNEQAFIVGSLLNRGIPNHTRFDAPNPVTYALRAFVFLLAAIRNTRSGGMETPACFVSFSIAATRSGCSLLSGSNLLNSGSMTRGVITISPRRIRTAGNQKYSHQRRGLRCITANRIKTRTIPNAKLRHSPLVQSQNHDPQP